jgi:ubiquinone/menaquinone biosynthesis C-methylase UbiE
MSRDEELRRIANFYNRDEWRGQSTAKYSFFNEANLYLYQARDRAIIRILRENGIQSLNGKTILDVGCGRGTELNNFVRYGAASANLHGVDLMDYRIADAIRNNPGIDFACGDASQLNFESRTFDITAQIMAFTSIVNDELKKNIALEMIRCTKPGGLILWVDFFLTNPFKRDPNVKAIGKAEIHSLFQGHNIHLTRCILTRPLVKLIAPYSIIACEVLERLSIFNSFYIGAIKLGHGVSR